MLQNTVIKIMAYILAVVLFTTAAGVVSSTSEVEASEQMNENDALRPMWAELPEQTHISRSRVKRFNRKQQLRQQRPRIAFKRALRRLFSLGHLREESKGSGVWIIDKRSTLRRISDFLTRRVQVIRHGFAVRRLAKQYERELAEIDSQTDENSAAVFTWALHVQNDIFMGWTDEVSPDDSLDKIVSHVVDYSTDCGHIESFSDIEVLRIENPTGERIYFYDAIAPQSNELFEYQWDDVCECKSCGTWTNEIDLTLENGPQCIECFLDETDALTQTREASDKYADCEPVEGLLSDLNPELVEYGNATLRRTFCVVAVIALISAFMPQKLAFSLAFIGAVRTPKPQWLKDAENSGVTVTSKGRSVPISGRKENTRAKSCTACGCDIPAGQYFAQLNAKKGNGEPYNSLKPHCQTCTADYVRVHSTIQSKPSQVASASVSEPLTVNVQNNTQRPNSFKGICAVCGVEVGRKEGFIHADSPKGHKIRCAEHATEALFNYKQEPAQGQKSNGAIRQEFMQPSQALSQAVSAQVSASLPSTTQGDKIELLQALLSGDGLNEEQVRSVAKAVVEQYAESAIQNGVQNASAHVEQRIEKVVSELKAQEVIKTLHIKPSKKAKAVKISGAYHPSVPTVFSILKAGLRSGKALPVYLVGEAGTGKSYAVAQVQAMLQAAKLQKSKAYGEIICFADMTRGDLLGNVKYGVGGKGSIEWQRSGLVKPLLEGGVAFVDEIDKADPAVLVLLNGVLASRTIINPATGEVLKVHDEAVIIAAGNTGGHSMGGAYKAAQIQDASLLDRFAATVVKFGFSARIAASICGLSHSMAEPENSPRGEPAQMSEVLKSYTELRQIVVGQTTVQFSNRALLHASILAKDGWTLNAIIGRWVEPLDSELRREVLNHFGMIDGEALSMVPQGIFEPESVDIAGGA
jgi:MoxR-like ATPase